jgi:hypothetical protein
MSVYPGLPNMQPPDDKPHGTSYAGVLARGDHDRAAEWLTEAGFTGWLGPQQGDWVVLVAARPEGPIAAGRTAVEDLARSLAAALPALVLAVTVREDRLLRILVADGDDERGTYVSNPAFGLPPEQAQEVWPDPQGIDVIARLGTDLGCGEEVVEMLLELVSEPLDEESQIESERLSMLLRTLGLPRWLVAADVLPDDVPGGPSADEVTRFTAGHVGGSGLLKGFARDRLRRLRKPR